MPLLPLSTNRTSTPLATQRLLQQLNNDQLGLQRNFDQLSSGRRVLTLSDDPAAAGRAISLTREIARSDQIVRNSNATQTYYDAADTALDSVTSALTLARATATSAAQTIVTDDERAGLAATIQETINSVFTAANSSYRDHQILGGVLGDGQPYRFDGHEIVYEGKFAIGKTEIGAGQRTDLNVSGNKALGTGSVLIQGGSLGASVNRDSRLIDLRNGRGVTPGALEISGGGNIVEVDLSGAFTIGDVTDILSDVEIDGRQLTAEVLPDGIRVGYADATAGTLLIRDQPGSQMAVELAISNPSGLKAPPLTGDRLTPRLTLNTQIADLAGGAGLNLAGGILIQQGGQDFPVNFDSSETIGDVLIAINRSDADVRAELNEAEGRIVIRSLRFGVDYSIGENGGAAAKNLKIRSADGTTRLKDLAKEQGLRLNKDRTDLVLSRPDGIDVEINLDGAETIDDVIAIVRSHPQNQGGTRILIGLNATGNGLQLRAPPGSRPLSVRQVGLSDAAIRLGWVDPGQTSADGSVVGSVDTIVGRDYAARDAGGTLDTLLRMHTAVRDGDIPELGRLQSKLDSDLDRSSRTRGQIGVWGRNLMELRDITESRKISLESSRSQELDADLAKVISDISQRQLALEASMRLIGQTSNLTVLNYL